MALVSIYKGFTVKKGYARNVCDYSHDDTDTCSTLSFPIFYFRFKVYNVSFILCSVKQGSNVVVAANSQGTIKVMISVLNSYSCISYVIKDCCET